MTSSVVEELRKKDTSQTFSDETLGVFHLMVDGMTRSGCERLRRAWRDAKEDLIANGDFEEARTLVNLERMIDPIIESKPVQKRGPKKAKK